MPKPAVAQLITRRGWLARGESVVASTGLALAVILLTAMGASAWWTLRSQQQAAEAAHREQLQALGDTLAQAAESLLAADELSAVRRLISDAGRTNRLQQCRIVLNDGRIIADLDLSKITVNRLPDRGSSDAAESAPASSETNKAIAPNGLIFPIEIPDRIASGGVQTGGSARLELAGGDVQSALQSLESQTGLGLIGAAGMLALLVIYRRMRSRLRAMGAIREALLARHSGERSYAALAVAADAAAESAAWNELIAENDRMRVQLVAQQIHQVEPAGRDSASDLEGVCDAMWQGLLLVDEQLRIIYANGAAAVLLRANREHMIGRDVTSLAIDDSLMEPIRQVVNGTLRRRVTNEVKLEGDDGQGVLRFHVRPVRRGDSAAAMVIVEDVTQQRLAEEARNLFIAQATHELRMPLTNIRLYTENAMEIAGHELGQGAGSPSTRRNSQSAHAPASQDAKSTAQDAQAGNMSQLAVSLNVINQESKRLERIVGDMLSVAEIEAGTLKLRMGDVRLETLFEEIRNDYLALAAQKNVNLHFNLPPKLPAITGDRDKITLALHNLVGNAIKYTPEQGSVTVNVELADNKLVVEVSDTGIGIGEEELEMIFERFYRSKDRRIADITGTGLGLPIARELIRLHHGDITVRSKINEGSTFTLTVPTMREAA